MELWSTFSRIVCIEALLGTSNFILEIINRSLFPTIGWNYLRHFNEYHLTALLQGI